jgi:general secretion pathway protein C
MLLSLFALVALSASIAYWVLQFYQPAQRPLAAAAAPSVPEPAMEAAATLFGGQLSAVVASNYQLTGVVAAGRESVAIIVADNGQPKALKLGKEVASGVTVQEVHPRYVMLSEGGVLKRIELATDAKAGVELAAPVAPGGGMGGGMGRAPVPGSAGMPGMPGTPGGQVGPGGMVGAQGMPDGGEAPVPTPAQLQSEPPPEVKTEPAEAPPPPPPAQMPAPTRAVIQPAAPPPGQ